MSAVENEIVSLNYVMTQAINAWRAGDSEKSAIICRSILAQRPKHQGAKHLLMTLENGVNGLVFTAIMLNDPAVFNIGDFSYGVPFVMLHNQPDEPVMLSVGSYCTIAHDVSIYLGAYHRHDTFTIYPFSAPHLGTCFSSTGGIKDYSTTRGGVKVGNDVWVGAHSVILSGVTIGDGAIIGAGSVVSRDVGPYEVWAGNPAEFRRRRFDEETSERLLRLRWWSWPKEQVEAHAKEIMSGSEAALRKLESVKFRIDHKKREQDGACLWVTGRSLSIRALRSKSWESGRPIWVVLHGSLGAIETVAGIAASVTHANLLFLDLPGCGGTDAPDDVSVSGFAAELLPALKKLVSEDFWILGVSFGGCVGLELARQSANCKGVVLLDTPFTAKKLWQNHIFLRRMIDGEPDNSYIRRFAFEIYGVTEFAAIERSYWNLLDGLEVPVVMVTGDVPLLPRRAVPPVPCCLDEEDLRRLAERGVTVVKVPGGHDLINENPKGISKVMESFS